MRIFVKSLILSTLSVFLSLPAISQSILGTAIINNKTVEVLDNNTWRYKSSDRQDLSKCDSFKLGVYFCNDEKWRSIDASGDANYMYMVDDRTYVMFIIEQMGSDDGVTQEFMKNIAIDYAAKASNTRNENIPQHFSKSSAVNNNDYLNLAYSAQIDGVSFTFINNIYVGKVVTMQAITYGVGPKVTDKLLAVNKTLIENIIIPE
jgi:hypothetical protein